MLEGFTKQKKEIANVQHLRVHAYLCVGTCAGTCIVECDGFMVQWFGQQHVILSCLYGSMRNTVMLTTYNNVLCTWFPSNSPRHTALEEVEQRFPALFGVHWRPINTVCPLISDA